MMIFITSHLLSWVKFASVKPTVLASMVPHFSHALRRGTAHQGAQWGPFPESSLRYHFRD